MLQNAIKQMEASGLPVTYREWPENEAPPLPWVCWLLEDTDNLFADGGVYYPVDAPHFSGLIMDAYVTAPPDPVSAPQPFRIYFISKPAKGLVTVRARHAAYRNKKITVSPFTASSAPEALDQLKANAVNDCPFSFWTDKTDSGQLQVSVPTDIWTVLGSTEGSILNVYGGEYEFDCWTVRLWNRRGTDRGVSVRYGKNLTDLKMDENISEVFTGVYPYWKGTEGVLVELPEKFLCGPGEYPEDKIMPLDLSQAFDEAPTEQQLRGAANQYISDNDIGKPQVSWTIFFALLEQTEEYKDSALLEQILLGDTVSVVFPRLRVNVSARAVAVRYRPSLKRYISVTLGSVAPNLARTIAQQGQAIGQAKNPSALQQAVDRATSWITGGRGYMLAVRDDAGKWIEICSLDTPDISTAVNVWRWNNGGFGFSSTGYNGPYTVAITQDGHIVADFITTGTLDAALVKVKNLVAETLRSVLENSTLIIDGASLRLFTGENEAVELTNQYDGLPILYMRDYNENGERTDAMELSPHHLKIGGTSTEPTFSVSVSSGSVRLWVNADDDGKTLSWKDNGDGTYTLIGR